MNTCAHANSVACFDSKKIKLDSKLLLLIRFSDEAYSNNDMKEIPGNGKLALLHIDWYPIMVNHVRGSYLRNMIPKFIKYIKRKQ